MGAIHMQDIDLIQTIFSLLVLVFSIVAHEVSHGYMAQRLGDPTARLSGRLTMNPLHHIDMMGSVIVPIATWFSTANMLHGPYTFGWAKPVPYNAYNLRDQKWGEAKVALAGPLTNLGIALFFGLMIRFFGDLFTDNVYGILHYVVKINVGLAVFNLVPIPPLDGSKVLLTAIPFRYRYIGEYYTRYSLFLVFIFVVFLWQYFLPIVEGLYSLFVGN